MTVEVNGEMQHIADGATLDDVVRALVERIERGVAVALDGEVVPRSAWRSTPLAQGQRVEVLRAVQGG